MVAASETESLMLSSIGSAARARQIADRCEQRVKAYRAFLGEDRNGLAFTGLPLMTKTNYVQKYSTEDLLADNFQEVMAIFASSGSSGSAHYWPHLRSESRHAAVATRYLLEKTFRIRERKTMAIVAGALGSWIGGDYFSWILKSIALKVDYSFAVFTPGKQPAEIVEALAANTLRVEQFVLFLCPSDIPHLHYVAEAARKEIPVSRLRFVVMGEPIPEPARMAMQARTGLAQDEPFMISIYGSTETGVLGAESEASVALRKLLTVNADLAGHFGLTAAIPHLFHSTAADAYLELVNNEICVTRWQGIPIVRYNLRDLVTFYRWKAVRRAILESKLIAADQEIYRDTIRRAGNLLGDLLAVHGRADRLMIIGGSNLSEPILDAAVRCPALAKILSGKYRAQVVYLREQQFLRMELEKAPGVVMEDGLAQVVHDTLIQELCRLQPEFKGDWQTVYRLSEADPRRRVLQIDYLEWPVLSHSNAAKLASLTPNVHGP